MKTVRELLQLAINFLLEKKIATPRLDAELLLAKALAIDRVKLYCSLDKPVNDEETTLFREMIRRRIAHEPIAYILGTKEFYGLDFSVTPAVLIPRPDTETLVDAALKWLNEKGENQKVFDLGTGSGAIAITIAVKNKSCFVYASDIKQDALDIAQKNAEHHLVAQRMDFVTGDLFAGCNGPFDLIVSNPPYISIDDKETLALEIVNHEPHVALFAENDGLQVISNLVKEAIKKLAKGGALMVEIGHNQKEKVYNLFKSTGVFEEIRFEKDLAGIDRIVCGEGYLGDFNG